MSVPRRILALLTGLIATAATALALAPAASAHPLAHLVAPPPGDPAASTLAKPIVTAHAPVHAQLPFWAIMTVVVGAMLVAAATTLVTLSLDRAHQRRIPFAV